MKAFESTQRLASIRQMGVYRTVSDYAANLLARDIPINIAIKRTAEARKTWHANRINEIYGQSMEEWQELWNNAAKAR